MVQPIFRDFTKKRPPIYFTIDEDRFDCHKALPIESLGRLIIGSRGMSGTDEAVDPSQVFDRIEPVVKVLLKKESYKRFMARFKPPLDDDGNIIDEDDWEPIDHVQLMEAIKWAVEIYTKDHTQSPPDLSSGSLSGEPGSSSTAGVQPEELILPPSVANSSLA